MPRNLIARDPQEQHRASSPLELFVDLCFVVGVSVAADQLHESLVEGHVATALLGYPMVFFAVWWAWTNFTWFASAYDNDDVLYRLTVFVIIFGVLVVSAGIPAAFEDQDFRLTVLGYVIMRLAMVTLWLRAAASDPPRRHTALRYAAGVTVLQVCWILLLFVPAHAQLPLFAVLVVGELAVPVWAERKEPTTWHPGHISERYGLFTLIVLGESILGIAAAVQSALNEAAVAELTLTAVGGLVIVCGMWWLYFNEPIEEYVVTLRERFDQDSRVTGFVWGYGHYVIYMAAAATGAGIAVVVDALDRRAEIDAAQATLAVAVPLAIYVVCMWLLHLRSQPSPVQWAFYVLGAACIVVVGALAAPLLVLGAIVAVIIAGTALLGRRGEPVPASV